MAGFDTSTSRSRSSSVERRFTNVVLALRRVSGRSSSALSSAALSAPIAPKAVFALLTRSARSSRRSAIAVTASEVSVTKRSRTFWSSASSRVRSLPLDEERAEVLGRLARLLALAVVLVAEASDDVPETLARAVVERVEERVDVHRRRRLVSADLPAVIDLAAVVRARLERHVAVGDSRQRGGADRRRGALVQAAEVVVDLQRDDGLRLDRRARCRRRVPIFPPPTCTGLPGTSWPAFRKTALTL